MVCLIIIGFTYQKIGIYTDGRKYKPSGQVVKVNGHNMHIYAEGQGDITVVFISGCGTPSPYADFYPLYNEISKDTRVVVYERPGYGWSEITETSRDIDTVTEELYELLEKAGEKPPYVLVSHSLASLETLRFAQLYSDKVKGIIMIDAGSPEYYSQYKTQLYLPILRLTENIGNLTGISRILYKHTKLYSYNIASIFRNKLSLIPNELKEIDEAMYLMSSNNKNVIDEEKNIKDNANIVLSNEKLNNIPLRIFSSDNSNKYDKGWRESQEKFIEWSNNSKQVEVSETKHYIHLFNPEIINKEIKELIKK